MLNERLKELRKLKNLTQQQLAEILGIDRSNYANYERGKRIPPIDKIEKIADFFNVSIDYLMGREELTPDQELAAILSDPDMHVAFQDYDSWTDDDKRELIAYLKAKKIARDNKEK